MTTIELSNDLQTTTPINDEILTFLDYVVLLLSQANSADEIDLIMDDFMSDDIIEVFTEHSPIFSIIPAIWLNTYERIFQENSNETFPLKLLWLPVLFKKMNWEMSDNEQLQNIYAGSRKKLEEDMSMYNMLNMLFLEGLQGDFHNAYENFNQMCSNLRLSAIEQQGLKSIKDDILSLGW